MNSIYFFTFTPSIFYKRKKYFISTLGKIINISYLLALCAVTIIFIVKFYTYGTYSIFQADLPYSSNIINRSATFGFRLINTETQEEEDINQKYFSVYFFNSSQDQNIIFRWEKISHSFSNKSVTLYRNLTTFNNLGLSIFKCENYNDSDMCESETKIKKKLDSLEIEVFLKLTFPEEDSEDIVQEIVVHKYPLNNKSYKASLILSPVLMTEEGSFQFFESPKIHEDNFIQMEEIKIEKEPKNFDFLQLGNDDDDEDEAEIEELIEDRSIYNLPSPINIISFELSKKYRRRYVQYVNFFYTIFPMYVSFVMMIKFIFKTLYVIVENYQYEKDYEKTFEKRVKVHMKQGISKPIGPNLMGQNDSLVSMIFINNSGTNEAGGKSKQVIIDKNNSNNSLFSFQNKKEVSPPVKLSVKVNNTTTFQKFVSSKKFTGSFMCCFKRKINLAKLAKKIKLKESVKKYSSLEEISAHLNYIDEIFEKSVST